MFHVEHVPSEAWARALALLTIESGLGYWCRGCTGLRPCLGLSVPRGTWLHFGHPLDAAWGIAEGHEPGFGGGGADVVIADGGQFDPVEGDVGLLALDYWQLAALGGLEADGFHVEHDGDLVVAVLLGAERGFGDQGCGADLDVNAALFEKLTADSDTGRFITLHMATGQIGIALLDVAGDEHV